MSGLAGRPETEVAEALHGSRGSGIFAIDGFCWPIDCLLPVFPQCVSCLLWPNVLSDRDTCQIGLGHPHGLLLTLLFPFRQIFKYGHNYLDRNQRSQGQCLIFLFTTNNYLCQYLPYHKSCSPGPRCYYFIFSLSFTAIDSKAYTMSSVSEILCV